MKVDLHRAIVTSYFDSWNQIGSDFFDKFSDPRIKLTIYSTKEKPHFLYKGVQEIKGFQNLSFKVFPDFESHYSDFVVKDQEIWARFRFTGTYSGITEISHNPSGKKFAIRGLVIMTIKDEKVCKIDSYEDLTEYLIAIGSLSISNKGDALACSYIKYLQSEGIIDLDD